MSVTHLKAIHQKSGGWSPFAVWHPLGADLSIQHEVAIQIRLKSLLSLQCNRDLRCVWKIKFHLEARRRLANLIQAQLQTAVFVRIDLCECQNSTAIV